jgi:hypothetical protein
MKRRIGALIIRTKKTLSLWNQRSDRTNLRGRSIMTASRLKGGG